MASNNSINNRALNGFTAEGGTVNIAADATTSTTNVGTGSGAKTTNLGSANTTSTTTIQGGTGGIQLSGTFVNMPTTTATVGQLRINNNRVLHTYGTSNFYAGAGAGNFTLTGADNYALGASAMASFTSGDSSIAIGTQALGNVTTGSKNIALGFQSGFSNNGSFNVSIGVSSMNTLTGGNHNVALGSFSGQGLTGSNSNNIMINNVGTAGDGNTLRIGAGAGTGDRQLNKSFIHGIRGITTANEDAIPVVIDSAGQLGTSVNTNTATNLVSLPATTATVGQIRIGINPVIHTMGGDLNIFSGVLSGNFTLTGNSNTCYGYETGNDLTTGSFNVIIGRGSGQSCTTGNNNVAVGLNALSQITTFSENVAIGSGALQNLNGGNYNTAVGFRSLQNILTGERNLSLGTPNNGLNYNGAESSNITLNANTSTIAAESNVLRIGNATGSGITELNKAFIHGIRGITTVADDAIAVLVSSTGQLGTVSSSIRYKENVQDMADSSSALLKLRPVTFDFIGKPSSKRQVGLIAEEVYEVMPDLVVHNIDGEIESVKYHELPALLLNELKKAVARIDKLEEQLKAKE